MVKRAFVLAAAAAGTAAGLAVLRARRRVDLSGQVVLITGGSRGLGLALAREFASRGCHLILCARSGDELERAKTDLSAFPARVVTVRCDVTDADQVGKCVEEAISQFGRIDILVNNAGAIIVGPAQTMTLDDFAQAMDVMFWGTVHATLACLPHFRARGCGRIVNITSIGGLVSVPHLLPYSCAKFAVTAFSEGLGAELRGSGIKVFTIAPGLMRTGSFVNAYFKGAERGEAGWFSAAASFPGVSMSARRAARQILGSIERGKTERILGSPAKLMAWFHDLFPESTLAALGAVNHLLPRGSQRSELGKDSKLLSEPWMRALTFLGRRAAKEHLQPIGSTH
jgi:short-subunit dehydrogenase